MKEERILSFHVVYILVISLMCSYFLNPYCLSNIAHFLLFQGAMQDVMT